LLVVRTATCSLAWTWKLRAEAALRKAVFESSGSLCARRAGPWRTVRVNDIVVRSVVDR
jgi:hypothetical protein